MNFMVVFLVEVVVVIDGECCVGDIGGGRVC